MAHPTKIIMIPAGGMGPAICEIVCGDWDKWEVAGFLDDDVELKGHLIPAYVMRLEKDEVGQIWQLGREETAYPVLNSISAFSQYSDCQFIIAGFANDKDIDRVRRTHEMMVLPDSRFETVIHPSAEISHFAEIGNGTVIMAGVTIAPGVKIGNHVMVMPNAVIEHNSEIHDYCNICAGAIISGYVTIAECCWIGANASITSKIIVGCSSLVGIGAVVIRNVINESVMVGNPARLLRHIHEE